MCAVGDDEFVAYLSGAFIVRADVTRDSECVTSDVEVVNLGRNDGESRSRDFLLGAEEAEMQIAEMGDRRTIASG